MNKEAILESWKEIASYLKRSVRTSRRWEREFGLPVHRLEEAAHSHVFAEMEELDVWMKEKFHLAVPKQKLPPLFRSIAVPHDPRGLGTGSQPPQASPREALPGIQITSQSPKTLNLFFLGFFLTN